LLAQLLNFLDWHKAFVICRCVRDFLAAHLRCDRIGCKHKDERMGSLDCPVDRFLPCVSGRNPFSIDPGFPVTTLQFFVQPAHELLILARIRDEDFLWTRRLLVGWPALLA
jgi:hypothetical protein